MPKTTDATTVRVPVTLTCGHSTTAAKGEYASCPRGCTPDTPDHRRRWC